MHSLACPCTSPAPASPELHDRHVHRQPPPLTCWVDAYGSKMGPVPSQTHVQNLAQAGRFLAVPKQAELDTGTSPGEAPWLCLPSRTLPSLTASLRKQPTDVTNTLTARSLLHPPKPGLCLLRPLHSPLGNSGLGTRFALPAAAGDGDCLRTPPVPAEGTVAPDHFQLLSSALAGRARGEQTVDLPWVTW